MATVEEFTDPFLSSYTPVPSAGTIGACDVCHGPTALRDDGAWWPRCYSCRETMKGVSYPILLVVPISLYRIGEQLHTVLAGYKRSTDPKVRERLGLQVGATLHRFLWAHGAHIAQEAGGTWDTVTIVPSKDAREGTHPLEVAIGLAEPLASLYRSLLSPLEPQGIGRLRSSDRGFSVSKNASGRRVLLIDDTFTSGATFQSAASALVLGGAHVIAGVVIGRVVDTSDSRYPEKLEWWEQRRAIPYNFGTCCLE